LTYQMTTISRLASFSLDHKLCRKLMGNTNAALPSISSTSSTKNNHRASPKYVFCSIPAHVSYHIVLNQLLLTRRLMSVTHECKLVAESCLAKLLIPQAHVCIIAGFCWLKKAYPPPRFDMKSQLKDIELLVRKQAGGC